MKSVAVYNMKGGVGKTTTAVNLSYLTAARGARTLLWDLDPQAASSLAFRVRPRVEAFDKRSLESGGALSASIKATDFENLDILPAAFAYRKFDRFLDRLGSPDRVMADLVESIGGDYDVVFLDCPAGFSLLIEGIVAAVDAVLVPTIPSVWSIRTLARLLKWADRSQASFELMAFLNMVDGRKLLHRRACEWAREAPGVFLDSQIPHASAVEHMAVERRPLPVFAPGHPATAAFVAIDQALDRRFRAASGRAGEERDWATPLAAVELLAARLETEDALRQAPAGRTTPGAGAGPGRERGPHAVIGAPRASIVHRFDTDRGDLERSGRTLELREGQGIFVVVLEQSGAGRGVHSSTSRVQAQIDRAWAREILSGLTSPLTALERRLGHSDPLREACAITGEQLVRRIDSRALEAGRDSQPASGPHAAPVLSIVRQAG